MRSLALTTLKEISAELSKRGEDYGAAEIRKKYISARLDILSAQVKPPYVICAFAKSEHMMQIDQDFVSTQVRKITDGRRKVLEGVGKGMTRIVAAYAT